jgi:transcriptional regulator with XRE-family HTH domain
MAERLGVPDYYISRWERGGILPSRYYQQKLCELFGKTAAELGLLQQEEDTLPPSLPEMKPEPIPTPPLSGAVATPLAEPIDEPLPSLPATPVPPFLSSSTGLPSLDEGTLPQEPASPHPVETVPTSPLPGQAAHAVSPSPSVGDQLRSWKRLVWLALILIVLLGAGGWLWSARVGLPFPVAHAVVGHLYFLSSGQVNPTSSQGVADEVQLDLQGVPAPSKGNSYYAWLLPDERASENPAVLLGTVAVAQGQGHLSYSDPQHTNLLTLTSGLLITEQDATVTPLAPSPDRKEWRYFVRIPQSVPAGEQYSLLDHLRHLLAYDPTLQAHGLPGGLAIWLYRNSQKLYAWSLSARDSWQSDQRSGASSIRHNLICILDDLDGVSFVGRDLPGASSSAVQVDPGLGSIGLLQLTPEQQPPGYLHHVSLHLEGVSASTDASAWQREQAARILSALNAVNAWLEHVRQDAKQLLAFSDAQLQQPQALILLNDLVTYATFTLTGKSDQVSGNVQPGVAWIYLATQRLATLEITAYQADARS